MTKKIQDASVIVDGGYQPATVVLKKGVPAHLSFKRISEKGCLDMVVLPDFGIKEKLPLNQEKVFTIDTRIPGEHQFSCGMNMFHGKVVIK